jgi:hypothetical protein
LQHYSIIVLHAQESLLTSPQGEQAPMCYWLAATILSLSLLSLLLFLHSHQFQEQHLGFSSFAWKEIILINFIGFCKKTSTIET